MGLQFYSLVNIQFFWLPLVSSQSRQYLCVSMSVSQCLYVSMHTSWLVRCGWDLCACPPVLTLREGRAGWSLTHRWCRNTDQVPTLHWAAFWALYLYLILTTILEDYYVHFTVEKTDNLSLNNLAVTFTCVGRGRERISNRKLDSGLPALDSIATTSICRQRTCVWG